MSLLADEHGINFSLFLVLVSSSILLFSMSETFTSEAGKEEAQSFFVCLFVF